MLRIEKEKSLEADMTDTLKQLKNSNTEIKIKQQQMAECLLHQPLTFHYETM